MFDVDLLNKTGIQRNVSRMKVNEKSKKQKIIFEELSSDIIDNFDEYNPSSKKDTLISFLLMGVLITGFLYLGISNYNHLNINNKLFTEYQDDDMLSDIILLMERADDMTELQGMELNNSFNFSLLMSDLDNIKLVNNKSLKYSHKIYHTGENQFRIFFSYPLNKSSDNNRNQELSAIMQRYKNDYSVESRMYNGSILFTSDSKIILKILQDLLYGGKIRLWPIGNGRFNLEYTS